VVKTVLVYSLVYYLKTYHSAVSNKNFLKVYFETTPLLVATFMSYSNSKNLSVHFSFTESQVLMYFCA